MPDDFLTFKRDLPHLYKALRGTEPVRIVAMGSSSTAGRGDDVVPYPARLEMYLRWEYQARFPSQFKLDVLNRGKGGEEAPDELNRFDDIFCEKPSLVIWQVGTNAVFRKTHQIKDTAKAISDGLQRLAGKDFDVVLIDPQYVTAMLRDDCADDAEQMVSLIAAAADAAPGVNLFRRWALMRHWHIYDNIALPDMIDPLDQPDQLHQNDWSTMLVSRALFSAIQRKLA